MTLVEHCLCPLQPRTRAFVHEAEYLYFRDGRRRAGRCEVTCPLKLKPDDEFYLWGLLAVIWIWVTRGLWNLDPQAWLFVVVLASLNLIMAVVSILGASTWQSVAATILLNGIILIYALTPGVKNAFGTATLSQQ